MRFTAWADGRFTYPGVEVRAALGRAGVIAAADKREGDGKSPAGAYEIRRVLYRPDRGVAPPTTLPCQPIAPDDGWCDDPADAAYNRLIRLPSVARHEALWRNDGLYDLIVVLGHNDEPVVPGMGSAIFLHLVRNETYPATEGCIALSRADMEAFLAVAKPGDVVEIR